jgi:hypothetical protein
MQLDWPYEGATPLPPGAPRFAQAGSNICLDFHGDPRVSRLVVFSDGNHHMALADALAAFRGRHGAVGDIFYVTTPPSVVTDAMKAGFLAVGSLCFSVRPHVFIGPTPLLERLHAEGSVGHPEAVASSRGIALLVRKGNPLRIAGCADLAREDVRLFLSNPQKESVSYRIYATTLQRVGARIGVDMGFLDRIPGTSSRVVYGESIHHREAPQCLADDRADVAVVFHHLALRYTRIFPGMFDLVPLTHEGDPDQEIGKTGIALVGDGGEWGSRLLEFMLGEEVAHMYRDHGLDPAR